MTRGALLLESKGRIACVTSNGPNVLVCKVLVTSSATDLFQKAISITRKLTCLDYGSGKGGFLCAYRWDGEEEIRTGKVLTAGMRV